MKHIASFPMWMYANRFGKEKWDASSWITKWNSNGRDLVILTIGLGPKTQMTMRALTKLLNFVAVFQMVATDHAHVGPMASVSYPNALNS